MSDRNSGYLTYLVYPLFLILTTMGFCCRMSDVDQPSGDHSADSAQHSAAGPVPALHTLAEYMRLIPPNALTNYGEPGTTPFREWTMPMLG